MIYHFTKTTEYCVNHLTHQNQHVLLYKHLSSSSCKYSFWLPSKFLEHLICTGQKLAGSMMSMAASFRQNKFGLNGSAFEKGKPLATSTDSCPPQHLDNPSIHDLQNVQQFSQHAADAIFWTCCKIYIRLCKFLLIFLLPRRMCVQIFKFCKKKTGFVA